MNHEPWAFCMTVLSLPPCSPNSVSWEALTWLLAFQLLEGSICEESSLDHCWWAAPFLVGVEHFYAEQYEVLFASWGLCVTLWLSTTSSNWPLAVGIGSMNENAE